MCSARGGCTAGGSAPRWGAGRCEALLGPCRPGDSINLQNNGLHHLRAEKVEAQVTGVGGRGPAGWVRGWCWRPGLALSNMPPSMGHPQLSQEAALSEWPSCSAGAGGRAVSQQPVLAALSTANFGSVPGCRPGRPVSISQMRKQRPYKGSGRPWPQVPAWTLLALAQLLPGLAATLKPLPRHPTLSCCWWGHRPAHLTWELPLGPPHPSLPRPRLSLPGTPRQLAAQGCPPHLLCRWPCVMRQWIGRALLFSLYFPLVCTSVYSEHA